MKLIQLINNDAYRYEEGKFVSYTNRPLFRVAFWYCIVCYLKRNNLLKYNLGSIAYLIFKHHEVKYGVYLNTNTPI